MQGLPGLREEASGLKRQTTLLERFVVVLFEPQDLVNIALVTRGMKNMGLSRLRLVTPGEFDAYRITGIAHDTEDLVERTEIYDSIEDAVAGTVRMVAATARRRSTQQNWTSPEAGAPRWVEHARDGDVAIVFGREDRGLPNHVMDLCQEATCIPTSDHTSMNLGHAAVLLMYEIRRAVAGAVGLPERDMSGKPRDCSPPATMEEMERFFVVWEQAMDEIGMFRDLAPITKMRNYRKLFGRASLTQRDQRLLEATGYRILNCARRLEDPS